MKYRIIVRSDECGWVVFSAGFFDTERLAWEQIDIYRGTYPDREFNVHSVAT